MSSELYTSVGGRLIASGSDGASASDGYWDFGWRDFAVRSDEENEACARIESSMPRFAISGRSREGDAKKVNLTELWGHQAVVARLGFAYSGTHQLTGSCVGAGGGNVAASLSFVEVIRLGDPEQVILPFYLYTYGRSRYRSGSRGRGEGSSGSGWADAATKDGVLDNLSHPELPKPTNGDGLVWGAAREMEWSAGDQNPCAGAVELGRKHLIKTASRLRSAADVRQAIANLYPVTVASMYGFTPRVEKGVLLGIQGPRWSHQMSIHAWWEHPELGEIYWLHNQWGLNAHGKCPTGMPGGGVWVTAKDVDWICRTGEAFAFSQFDGYPAPDFDVSLVYG